MPPLRVLHCPTTTGGHAAGLARAERELGLASWSAAILRTRFEYAVDEAPRHSRLWWLSMETRRWSLLARALTRYDLVHFNFGQSLMPIWNGDQGPAVRGIPWLARKVYGLYARALESSDLPLLRSAGKGIVVTFQGCDARQGGYCRSHFPVHFADEVQPGYYTPYSDARKQRRIARFARYADRIYSLNPDLMHVLPPSTRFLPYAHANLAEWAPAPPLPAAGRVPVVLHAPSDRSIKGTRFVLDAVSRLKAAGVELELLLAEDVPYAEMPAVYAKADLIVDQVLAGWYGGAAVEAMAIGRPVVCYLRENDLGYIPALMRSQLPLIQATPDSLFDVLRRWLTSDRHLLAQRGALSRQFVETWHNPLTVAAELKADYESIMADKRQRIAPAAAGKAAAESSAAALR